MYTKTTKSLAIAVIALLIAGGALGQSVRLPAPTGTFDVGRRLVHWVDQSRVDVLSPGGKDKREVLVWLWYPAKKLGAAPALYVEQLEKLAKALPEEGVSLAKSAQGASIASAEPMDAPTKFPVILFSPGGNSIPAIYTSLTEELASQGFVVAAVDHPYDDLAVLLSDGRIAQSPNKPAGGEESLRYERERVPVRARDMSFVLDQLEQVADGRIRDALTGKLDLTHVGTLGHSIGGITAAEVCKRDVRVSACANMDGVVNALPAYSEDIPQGLEHPFLFLEKPFRATEGETSEEANRRIALLRSRGDAILAGVRSGSSFRVTIDQATHATFSDEEFLTSGGAERQAKLLVLIRSYLTAFFARTLRGESNTLLDRPPTVDGVRIQTFTPK